MASKGGQCPSHRKTVLPPLYRTMVRPQVKVSAQEVEVFTTLLKINFFNRLQSHDLKGAQWFIVQNPYSTVSSEANITHCICTPRRYRMYIQANQHILSSTVFAQMMAHHICTSTLFSICFSLKKVDPTDPHTSTWRTASLFFVAAQESIAWRRYIGEHLGYSSLLLPQTML